MSSCKTLATFFVVKKNIIFVCQRLKWLPWNLNSLLIDSCSSHSNFVGSHVAFFSRNVLKLLFSCFKNLPKELLGWVTTRSLSLRCFVALPKFVQGRVTTTPCYVQDIHIRVVTYHIEWLRTAQYVIGREYTPQYGLIIWLKPLNMVRNHSNRNWKGQKGVEAKEGLVNTSRRREKKGKA